MYNDLGTILHERHTAVRILMSVAVEYAETDSGDRSSSGHRAVSVGSSGHCQNQELTTLSLDD